LGATAVRNNWWLVELNYQQNTPRFHPQGWGIAKRQDRFYDNRLQALSAAYLIGKTLEYARFDARPTAHGNMPRKKSKLAVLADRIAAARRIIDAQ
jgi:hypothetical protein